MTWAFVRREWGAITFVLTVIVGMIVVPLSLYFLNQGPSAVATTPTICVATSARASSVRASGAQTATSVHSPSPCPTT